MEKRDLKMEPYREDFLCLMEEYAEFMQEMVPVEREKFDALLAGELPRIDQSISEGQANAMKLESYEKKRIALQRSAGFAGMTLRQIAAGAGESEKIRLQDVFARFVRCAGEIQHYNNKSMAFVKDALALSGAELSGAQAYSPRGARAKPGVFGAGDFETKI
jgi:hypothetical protein